MCLARGTSLEELGSHFHVYFLPLNQFGNFLTYIMTRHSPGSSGIISPFRLSKPHSNARLGWQVGVKAPAKLFSVLWTLRKK